MKSLKGVVLLVAVALLLPVMVVQAQAGWGTATVNSVGPANGQAYVSLTDTTGGNPSINGFWQLDPTQQNALLATALTAMSTGGKLNIFINSGNVVTIAYAQP